MDIREYMDGLLREPSTETDMEYLEIETKYKDKFGHIIPTEMLPPSVDKDKIKETMLKCLETNVDNALELLEVELNSEYLY